MRRATAKGPRGSGNASRNAEKRIDAPSALGKLVIVATPIGNLGDLSPRAAEALRQADLIAAEDTRVTAKILKRLDAQRPLTRIDQHASDHALLRLLDRIEKGETVAVATDAGTPGISDPGARLVDLAHGRGLPVDAIPGPSAITNALALAGFFAQQFVFLGFLSRRASAAVQELQRFRESTMTLVLFEAPTRLPKTLSAALTALGDRRAAICREMTKMHQQVLRARLSELAQLPPNFKGEVTVVIEGYRRNLEL